MVNVIVDVVVLVIVDVIVSRTVWVTAELEHPVITDNSTSIKTSVTERYLFTASASYPLSLILTYIRVNTFMPDLYKGGVLILRWV